MGKASRSKRVNREGAALQQVVEERALKGMALAMHVDDAEAAGQWMGVLEGLGTSIFARRFTFQSSTGMQEGDILMMAAMCNATDTYIKLMRAGLARSHRGVEFEFSKMLASFDDSRLTSEFRGTLTPIVERIIVPISMSNALCMLTDPILESLGPRAREVWMRIVQSYIALTEQAQIAAAFKRPSAKSIHSRKVRQQGGRL
ncbi:MAG: hypothetical protein V4508_08780 [Pseudomonadota bacterium]